jgi:hypothetical protein
MEHVPKFCMVADCNVEASYWITSEGFVEALMSEPAPATFYLCTDDMAKIVNDDTGLYHHLRIDRGDFRNGDWRIRLPSELRSLQRLTVCPPAPVRTNARTIFGMLPGSEASAKSASVSVRATNPTPKRSNRQTD